MCHLSVDEKGVVFERLQDCRRLEAKLEAISAQLSNKIELDKPCTRLLECRHTVSEPWVKGRGCDSLAVPPL